MSALVDLASLFFLAPERPNQSSVTPFQKHS
jgi:hypothetical protein